MRRYFHISLTFIYLVLCAGVNVYAHFCGSELAEVSAFIDAASCCCDENGTGSSCCNETVKTLKISQEHKSSQAVKLVQPIFYCKKEPIFIPVQLGTEAHQPPIFYADNSPPIDGVPIFIWNCVFTI